MATEPITADVALGGSSGTGLFDPYQDGHLVLLGPFEDGQANGHVRDWDPVGVDPNSIERGWINLDRHREGCSAVMTETQLRALDGVELDAALADPDAVFCDCDDEQAGGMTGPDGQTWHFRRAAAAAPGAMPATFARVAVLAE